uniref:Uncharacterized protein n=1 Tax=Oryza rufipogon TaxID=4529 RepID=A0A0E0MXX6_ORYRU
MAWANTVRWGGSQHLPWHTKSAGYERFQRRRCEIGRCIGMGGSTRHWRMASNILEYVDNFLFQSLREKDEEEVRIAMQRLQDDLQKKHHGSQHSVRRIAHELLGIATMSKWEYRKELPLPAAEDGMTMKKKLKCHAKKLRKLLTKHTLMGVVPLVWAKLEPMPMITSSGRTIKSNARFTGPEWTA